MMVGAQVCRSFVSLCESGLFSFVFSGRQVKSGESGNTQHHPTHKLSNRKLTVRHRTTWRDVHKQTIRRVRESHLADLCCVFIHPPAERCSPFQDNLMLSQVPAISQEAELSPVPLVSLDKNSTSSYLFCNISPSQHETPHAAPELLPSPKWFWSGAQERGGRTWRGHRGFTAAPAEASSEDLSSGSAGGSSLDFQTPLDEPGPPGRTQDQKWIDPERVGAHVCDQEPCEPM